MNYAKKILTIASAVVAVTAGAQDYGAAARTFDGGGAFANRLYTDNGFTTLAPVGTIVWFVADTANNGVPNNPLEGAVLGPDDVLIYQDVVDGTLIGSQAGRLSRNYTAATAVPGSTRDSSIYFYLWNQSSVQTTPSVTGFTPVAGNTFGLFYIGNVVEPAVGDAQWYITANVSSAQFVVNAVPEPSTYLLSGLSVLGMLAYRRFKK